MPSSVRQRSRGQCRCLQAYLADVMARLAELKWLRSNRQKTASQEGKVFCTVTIHHPTRSTAISKKTVGNSWGIWRWWAGDVLSVFYPPAFSLAPTHSAYA